MDCVYFLVTEDDDPLLFFSEDQLMSYVEHEGVTQGKVYIAEEYGTFQTTKTINLVTKEKFK